MDQWYIRVVEMYMLKCIKKIEVVTKSKELVQFAESC